MYENQPAAPNLHPRKTLGDGLLDAQLEVTEDGRDSVVEASLCQAVQDHLDVERVGL